MRSESSRALVVSVALATLACSAGAEDRASVDAPLPRSGPASSSASAQVAAPAQATTRDGRARTPAAGARALDAVPAAPTWTVATDAFALALDPHGNVDLLAASHLSELDPAGNLVWERPLREPGGDVPVAPKLVIGEHGWVVTGSGVTRADGTSALVVHAFDDAGAPAWDRTWPESAAVYGAGVTALDMREHVVAIVGADHTYVVDCDGASIWDAPLGGSVVRIGTDGDVFVGGTNAALQRQVTKLRESDGGTAWTTRLDDETLIRESALTGLALDAAGDLYVSGRRRLRRDPRQDTAQFESLAAKIGADGAIRWRHDTDLEVMQSVKVDGAGTVTLAGTYASVNTGIRALHVVQYATDGAQRWRAESTESLPTFGVPRLALGADGTPYTAATYESRAHTDTVAYGSDGAALWTATGGESALGIEAGAGGVYLLTEGAVSRFAP